MFDKKVHIDPTRASECVLQVFVCVDPQSRGVVTAHSMLLGPEFPGLIPDLLAKENSHHKVSVGSKFTFCLAVRRPTITRLYRILCRHLSNLKGY